jgi:hypothetical protein
MENDKKIKLDYTLKTMEERTAFIDNLIKEGGPTSPRWLEIYTNYIFDAQTKEEKKKYEILTDNRLVTINKNETSYEGLATKFENGEDGLHNILRQSDKNIILSPKDPITEKDIEEIPGLKQIKESIDNTILQLKTAQGKAKYQLKTQLIELYQDQYVIREAYRKPIRATKTTLSHYNLPIEEEIKIIDNSDVVSTGLVTFFNKEHVAALLRSFSLLKQQTRGQINSDFYYLKNDFEKLIENALKEEYPELYEIVQLKIQGLSGNNIQTILQKKFNNTYTLEYLSSLWHNKIPKIISEKAKDDYLEWYYTFKEKGKWKKCSCCGEIKLASTRFFSKNKSARDGLYSVCKKCRSAKYAAGKKV